MIEEQKNERKGKNGKILKMPGKLTDLLFKTTTEKKPAKKKKKKKGGNFKNY